MEQYLSGLNIQAFNGFEETTVRFLFRRGIELSDKSYSFPLNTVLSNGTLENKPKMISNLDSELSVRGIQAFTFELKVNDDVIIDNLPTDIQTYINKSERSVVKIWTHNADGDFNNIFTVIPISEADPTLYDMKAYINFKTVIETLFNQSCNINIYMSKKPILNTDGLLIGDSSNLITFLRDQILKPECKPFCDYLLAINYHSLEFTSKKYKKNIDDGTIKITMLPNTVYCLYIKKGYETMLMATPYNEFKIGRKLI